MSAISLKFLALLIAIPCVLFLQWINRNKPNPYAKSSSAKSAEQPNQTSIQTIDKRPGWVKTIELIWKIIGGICFLVCVFFLCMMPLFCDHGPICDNDTSLMIFLLGSWAVGIASFAGYIVLLPDPISARNLYRLDILLYILPFTDCIVHWLDFLPKDFPTFLWWVFIPFFFTIFIATTSSIATRVKRQKEIKKAMPPKPRPNEISDIFQAILKHNVENVKATLAQNPAHLNTPYAQNGNTPLHVAVWNGYKDIVELLLKQPGIDTQAKNLAGKTALDLAQEKNFLEIIEMLKFTEQK